MAIQKGNAVCVMGCPKDNSSGLEGLFKFQVHKAEELSHCPKLNMIEEK